MGIQVPQYCKFYTKNENMNKTCIYKGVTKMCKIYYDEICKEYKEKKYENRNNANNNRNNDFSTNSN